MTLGSKAAVCRALAQLPDAGRRELAVQFREIAFAGPLPEDEVIEILTGYLFDPRGRAINATTEAREQWLAGPLFLSIGPGNAVPIVDEIAALIVGPALGHDEMLDPIVIANRFAPHADEGVALALAALDPFAQPAMLAMLFSYPGPEPELLALSTLQCGRTLAWSPHLLATEIGEQIVTALLALQDAARPKPLLEALARVLGPIAKQDHPLADVVRTAALRRIDECAATELAATCAYILGFAAPHERTAFIAYRAVVLDRPDGEAIFVGFLDGLIAASHVPAVTDLVGAMLGGDDRAAATGLGIADAMPLDPIAPQLLAELESESPMRRAAATAAVELFGGNDIDGAIAARLFDPFAEVAAAATRVLVARGRIDLLALHITRDQHELRRAIALAGMGDLRVQTITELVRALIGGEVVEASPLLRLLGDCLTTSVAGFELAIELIGDLPSAAALLAVAAVAGAERDAAVLAPPEQRKKLAAVTLAFASLDDHRHTELAALALYLLSRMSAGDPAIAEIVSTALVATKQFAPQLIAALAELRVADEHTANALAPLLAASRPIGLRITAAAACGRALPRNHAAWADVRELLSLGPVPNAAAWRAIRERARRDG